MTMKTLTNDEITDKLLEEYKLANDNQLAKHFQVERQQIRQFRMAKRTGLTQKIITSLLHKPQSTRKKSNTSNSSDAEVKG